MDEHPIRLRGAWEWAYRDPGPVGSATRAAGRIDLPTPWPVAWDRPVRLTRRFGGPARAVAASTVRLRMASVPGLVRVVLNGEDLVGPAGPTAAWPVTGLLKPRNLLALEALPPSLIDRAPTPWGEVWLAFAAMGRTTPAAIEPRDV